MTLILTCNEIGVTNPHDIVICPINLLPFVVIGIVKLKLLYRQIYIIVTKYEIINIRQQTWNIV